MFNHAFLSLSVIERKLLYSGASLVAQPVKNPPAMQETPVQFLGWEDPLEEGMATHFSIFGLENPMDREAWQAMVHRVAKSQTRLKQLSTHERAWVIPAVDTC